MYITVNDILDDAGRIRPFEIFINSKNMEHYAWTVALTRMISAVFRRGGDVSFVVEELKAVFDPRGGQWMKGRYVPSLLAAIGEVIERHLIDVGFLSLRGDFNTEPKSEAAVVNMVPTVDSDYLRSKDTLNGESNSPSGPPFRQCPKCAQSSLTRQEGCDTCLSCAYSKCG
jgi:ribonucleoside-diphosphate reductase alpha chain